jgi:hypothetical protein
MRELEPDERWKVDFVTDSRLWLPHPRLAGHSLSWQARAQAGCCRRASLLTPSKLHTAGACCLLTDTRAAPIAPRV